MKNVILTPNPYRDKNFNTVRAAVQILKEAGVQTRVCLPFEVDRSYELPKDIRFSRLISVIATVSALSVSTVAVMVITFSIVVSIYILVVHLNTLSFNYWLTGQIHSQLFEGFDIHSRKHNGGVYLTALQFR